MKNFSLSQATNYASMTATMGIIIRIVTDPSNVTPEEWQIIGMILVAFGANVINWLNRYMKGDLKAIGSRIRSLE